MSKLWIAVLIANPVALPSGRMAEKGEGWIEVDKSDVVEQHIDSLYQVSKEKPEEAPEAPTGPDLNDLNHDQIAEKLLQEPDLIPADGFMTSGAPTVDAMEEAFGQPFKADERDTIWEKVQELKLGSLNS